MTITFPTTLDTLPNPTSTDLMENATLGLDHDQQHANANDAIEALEAKVGVTSSAVTTSHDYKLSEVTTTDKSVGKTATQTLTNKTLTTPVINTGSDATGDIYYRSAGGVFTRLAIGTNLQILQSNGTIPAWVANPSAVDATYAVKGMATLDANVRYHAADAGGTDAYAITLTDVPTAYVVGQKFSFKANTVNTGAATLNVNSLGAKTIVKGVNTTLIDGDIAAGQFCSVIYDGTNFVLQNPVAVPPTSFISGSLTTATITTTTTTDQVVTCGFAPKVITLYYNLRGTDNSSLSYTAGIAVYNSAGTLVSNQILLTATSAYTNFAYSLGTTAPSAGTTSGISNLITLSIPTVTSTSFTLRATTTAASSGQALITAAYAVVNP